MTAAPVPATDRPITSTRDYDDLRARLQPWFAERLTDPVIERFDIPSGNGMSSETILLDVTHVTGGTRQTEELVLRMPPASNAVPVFQTYDLAKQAYAMRLVRSTTAAPAPEVPYEESDPAALGAPFIVMHRVEGRVPPDIMPYTFGGNWLADATDDQRRRVQESTVAALAEIHTAPTDADTLAPLQTAAPGATSLRRHVNDLRAYYEWVVSDGKRSSVLEQAFAWLEANWPTAAEAGADVVSWGDSRIGNVLYASDGFEPVAILDWEMVGIGPREIDLGWLVYFVDYFQDLATTYGMPGIPTFMPRTEVVARYEALTGHTVNDLDWFYFYAAVRYGVVYFRIGRRQVLFGEVPEPDDPDALIIHAPMLRDWLASH